MQNAPTVVADDKEAVEHTEGDRWHGEEVHRRNGFSMLDGCARTQASVSQAKPLAARLERKHQCAITAILPEENRPVRQYPVGSGQSSAALKSTPEESLRLSDSCE